MHSETNRMSCLYATRYCIISIIIENNKYHAAITKIARMQERRSTEIKREKEKSESENAPWNDTFCFWSIMERYEMLKKRSCSTLKKIFFSLYFGSSSSFVYLHGDENNNEKDMSTLWNDTFCFVSITIYIVQYSPYLLLLYGYSNNWMERNAMLRMKELLLLCLFINIYIFN